VISSSQRPLPDNTQHSQQTDIHAPGGIRARNLSRRAAAELRLRPRGHWDRLLCCVGYINISSSSSSSCSYHRFGPLLTSSGLKRPQVSSIVFSGPFCRLVCIFLVFYVISNDPLCSHVVSNFFCSLVFCP
jgi:hypothetical protein